MRADRRLGFGWALPLLAACFLVGVDLYFGRLQLRVLSRGTIAPHTIRASTDAVFDLRKTYAEEARAARRNYLPIYNKDNAVFYEARETIIMAAKDAAWPWPEQSGSIRDAAVDGSASDGPNRAPLDRDRLDRASLDRGQSDRAPPDQGAARANDGGQNLDDAGAAARESHIDPERLDELDALMRGFFRLIEPYYKAGVVADNEFPSQKKEVRVLSIATDKSDTGPEIPRYVMQSASKLNRFSTLRPVLEKGAWQYFFKTDEVLKEQMISFILERLPPNLIYAPENKRVIDISEVTGVKVVLIRRGEILARKGQIIDSRAHHALRASIAAAARVSTAQRTIGQLGMLAALLLAFVVTSREVSPPLCRIRPQLLLYGALLALGLLGAVGLSRWPVHSSLLPHCALPLIFGIVFGRVPALLVAVVVPVALGIMHVFDLSTVAVGVAGGLAGGLVVRRRRRSGVLAAGVLVGLVQALVAEATRAIAARPQTYDELLGAAQAFGGGMLAGLVAMVMLPFIQRWFGLSSQGKLGVLADFEHPLARKLRDRLPETFAHTVKVISLADQAANAVDADRLLVRCAALHHDLGRLTDADEAQHAVAGADMAGEERFPAEVVTLIASHHGTQPIPEDGEPEADESADEAELKRYPGPKPQTREGAALMIADALVCAGVEQGDAEPAARVDEVLGRLMVDRQLEACPLTQLEISRIRDALVAYLEEKRSVQ